jgi:hypothetical protein
MFACVGISPDYPFHAEVWLYPAKAAWYFVSVPNDISAHIKSLARGILGPKRGFGSLRVRATIGSTSWTTSIFPHSQTQTYLLPLKKDVRNKESIAVGSTVSVTLTLLDI